MLPKFNGKITRNSLSLKKININYRIPNANSSTLIGTSALKIIYKEKRNKSLRHLYIKNYSIMIISRKSKKEKRVYS